MPTRSGAIFNEIQSKFDMSLDANNPNLRKLIERQRGNFDRRLL